MKVFLAGATGAIGRRLVPRLIEAGHHVTAITRQEKKRAELYELGAEPLLCDVFDARKLRSIMARAEPDAVVNELTDLPQSLNPRKLAEYYAANNRVRREGTRNLLSAALCTGVRRFLVQGSAYWYAPLGGPVKTEEVPLYLDAPPPIGPAVETIREVEEAVLSADGLEGIVLRYGMFCGPGTWYAKDGDVGRQVRKRRYPMIGNGEGTYSFIHVDDAADATMAALERARPGVYNVVVDEPATAAQWMPVYAEALGAKRPPRVPAFVARLIAGRALVAWSLSLRGTSNEKIKGELDWRPQYESWRRGFFEDIAAVTPGDVPNWRAVVRPRRASKRDVRTETGGSALDEAHPRVEWWRATIEQAAALPIPKGQHSVEVLSHGTMVVKYYAPRGTDEQTPHTRDELYVVAQGSGTFLNGDHQHHFSARDVLFVRAGVPHRFENFTDDFGTWVIFYGPEGGEQPR